MRTIQLLIPQQKECKYKYSGRFDIYSKLQMPNHVYILKLQHSCFYIGRSSRVNDRIQQHYKGRGSTWTKLHKPISTIDVIEIQSNFQEDMWVKRYMSQYSIDQVRGGSYSKAVLSQAQIICLVKQIRNAKDQCYLCGQPGHFAKFCKNRSSLATQKMQKNKKTSKNYKNKNNKNTIKPQESNQLRKEDDKLQYILNPEEQFQNSESIDSQQSQYLPKARQENKNRRLPLKKKKTKSIYKGSRNRKVKEGQCEDEEVKSCSPEIKGFFSQLFSLFSS